MMKPFPSVCWNFHGVGFRAASDIPLPSDLLFALRRHLSTLEDIAHPVEMTLVNEPLPPCAMENGVAILMKYDEILRGRCSVDQYWLQLGAGGVQGSTEQGIMRVFAPSSLWLCSPTVCRALIPLALTFHLARKNLFYAHAAALRDPQGRGWLFTGSHGAGKSTTAYALLNQGWQLMSDDDVLLHKKGSDVICLPFTDEFRLARAATEWFSNIEWVRPPTETIRKGIVDTNDACRIAEVRPERWVHLVVGTHKGARKQSVVNDAKGGATYLQGIVEDSPMIFVTGGRNHLDALTTLLGQCDRRCLTPGHDLLHNPTRVLEVVFN